MEVIAGVIIENVIKGLSSYPIEEFNLLCNLKDDFRRMNNTVSAIEAVLLDAEAKATDRLINVWLVKLKDVLYDADDLLDDFSFEALRRKVMTRNYMAKKTLKLNGCFQLEVLPRDINKLVNLIHLEFFETSSLGCMTYGLGQLTCLQTLTKFILNMDGGARISELRLLNNLSGSLSIYGLEQVRHNTMEVESTKLLLEKQYLQQLDLFWDHDENMERDELEEVAYKDEMILDALQPHPSIKSLTLLGFRGKSLPHWIRNLSSLQSLDLLNCPMLNERCKRETGEDWPKIAHIPFISVR